MDINRAKLNRTIDRNTEVSWQSDRIIEAIDEYEKSITEKVISKFIKRVNAEYKTMPNITKRQKEIIDGVMHIVAEEMKGESDE